MLIDFIVTFVAMVGLCWLVGLLDMSLLDTKNETVDFIIGVVYLIIVIGFLACLAKIVFYLFAFFGIFAIIIILIVVLGAIVTNS